MKIKFLISFPALIAGINTYVHAQSVCSCQDLNTCDLIENPSFTDICNTIFADPINSFANGDVPCWEASHGTPGPPGPGSCYNMANPSFCFSDAALMWSMGTASAPFPSVIGEGIFQRQAIDTDGKYLLTYKLNQNDEPLDHFWVHFINTPTPFAPTVTTFGEAIPTLSSKQTIHHVTNFTSSTYIQQCTSIVANNNYDAIWFYPQQNAGHDRSTAYITDVHLYKVDAGADKNYCSGQSATLGVPGCEDDIDYTWSPATGLSATNIAQPTCTLVNNGTTDITITYTVTGSVSCGSGSVSVSDYVTVTIHPSFSNLAINGNPYLCVGQEWDFFTNTTNAAYTYAWSATNASINTTSGTHTGITFNSTGTQTVTVTVTNPLTGCFNTVTYTVNVISPPPAPIITGGALYSCPGTYTYTIDHYDPDYAYTISVSGGILSSPITPPGNFNITWNGSPGSFIVSAWPPSPYTCFTTTLVEVPHCCYDASATANITPSQYYNINLLSVINAGSTTFNAQTFTVNGTFTIEQNAVFNNCTFKMGVNAKINVMNGVVVSFNNSTLTICHDPWDGIYVSSPTSNVIFNNTLAEHARNAIVSVTGGRYTIKNSFLKDNVIGIKVESYPLTAHTGTVTGTKFYTQLPVITGLPFVGISLTEQYHIQIGDPTLLLTPNIFTDINVGVSTLKSNYSVNNNNFSFIPGACPYITGPHAGIFTMNEGSNTVVPNISIKDNIFHKSENGILHSFINQATVDHNTFSKIADFGYYSYERDNISPALNIINNDMLEVKNGVTVIEPAMIKTQNVLVKNNSIKKTNRGVYFLSVEYPNATANCISLNDPANPSDWNVGVFQQNGNGLQAISNTVEGSNLGTHTIGVRADITPNCEIRDNYMTGCFISIQTLGDCPVSMLRCNSMYNYAGAGYYNLGGQIGPQGSSSATNYNMWYTGGIKIADALTYGNLSPFYVRTMAPYLVNPWESVNLTAYAPYTAIPVFAGSYSDPTKCGAGFPALPCSGITVPHAARSATDSTDDTQNILELYEWNSNTSIPKQVYEDYLQKDLFCKSYLNNSNDNFMDAGLPSAIRSVNEKWYELHNRVNVNLPSIDYSLPNQAINLRHLSANDSSAATMEALQVELNNLIENTFTRNKPYAFTPAEINALEFIALRCPVTHGRAVYEARAVLQPVTNKKYESQCENYFPLKNTPVSENAIQSLEIFPNPAHTSITLRTINASTQSTIEMYNATGQLVRAFTIDKNKTESTIDIQWLPEGLYVVHVLSNGITVGLKKFIRQH